MNCFVSTRRGVVHSVATNCIFAWCSFNHLSMQLKLRNEVTWQTVNFSFFKDHIVPFLSDSKMAEFQPVLCLPRLITAVAALLV